jgi:hypothetical protein
VCRGVCARRGHLCMGAGSGRVRAGGTTDRLQQQVGRSNQQQLQPVVCAGAAPWPLRPPRQHLGVPCSGTPLSRRDPRSAAAPARRRRQRPSGPPPRQRPSPAPACAPARARVCPASGGSHCCPRHRFGCSPRIPFAHVKRSRHRSRVSQLPFPGHLPTMIYWNYY